MLILHWGASGSGETSVLEPITQKLPELAVHDFDEVGVPSSPVKSWANPTSVKWIQRAIDTSVSSLESTVESVVSWLTEKLARRDV